MMSESAQAALDLAKALEHFIPDDRKRAAYIQTLASNVIDAEHAKAEHHGAVKLVDLPGLVVHINVSVTATPAELPLVLGYLANEARP